MLNLITLLAFSASISATPIVLNSIAATPANSNPAPTLLSSSNPSSRTVINLDSSTYVPLSASQQAKNLNAAIAALIVEKAINAILGSGSSSSSSNSNPPSVAPVTPAPVLSAPVLSPAKAPTSTPIPPPVAAPKTASNPTQYSSGGSTTVIQNCVNQGQFAMTFDDGPYVYNQQIADGFNPSGSKATFFVNGNNYDCIYDKADEIIARYNEGHQIASHTWTHADITTLSTADLNNQITLVETALYKILGIRPAFFRPPYGNYNDAAVKVLASRGYQTVMWSDDDGDSIGSTVEQSLADYNNIYSTFPAPHNYLNHETYATTAQNIIPVVVPKLLAAGWKLVTVAECVNLPAYQSPISYGGTPGVKDSSWTCAGTPSPGKN